MKKVFKYMIPCLALAFAFASCDDTMDDKAAIDAKYESLYNTATVSVTSTTAPVYNTVSINCTVGNVNDVAEEGIQFSATNDFTNVGYTPNDTVEASYTIEMTGLEEETTYYVRAYAMSKNGQVVYSEAQSVKTPAAPLTPLEGSYTVTEYDRDNAGNWIPQEPYKVTIEFDAEDPTVVNITNIWDAETTVQGVYDEATQTITVPNYQIIYVHPSYGEVWIQAVKKDFSDYEDAVTFTFNPRGGRMESTPMGAICTAGAFGYFYLDMQHDE